MKLNEQYLHKVLINSVNNFINEDINNETNFDFLHDIMNGDTVDVGTVDVNSDSQTELVMQGNSGYFYKIVFNGYYERWSSGGCEEEEKSVDGIELYCDFNEDGEDSEYISIPYEQNDEFEKWLIDIVYWNEEDYEDWSNYYEE